MKDLATIRILHSEPDNTTALHLLSMLYTEEGKLHEAAQCLKKAMRYEPRNTSFPLHLANVLKLQGALTEATAVLQQLVDAYPNLAAAYNNLGTIYFAQEKWTAAVAAYHVAIEKQADYIDAYYNLGLALNKATQWDEAIQAYQAVLALNPQHTPAQFQLGCLLLQKNHVDEARQIFVRIEKEYPHHVETQSNLGTCYLKQAAFAQAKTHYLKALQIKPDDTQILFNLAVIHMQQNRIEEAMLYYQQILKINPHHFAAHNNLGTAWLTSSHRNAALVHFREALRLQPHHQAVRHIVNVLTENTVLAHSPTEYIKALFDSYADHYDQHVLHTLHYQMPTHFLSALQQLRDVTKPQWDIIDLGCGTGLCGSLFKPAAHTLTGVDLSEKMLAVAAQKNIYEPLICENILPFLSHCKQTYDFILAGDVLVYFGDLSEIFSHATHILRNQGLFIFDVESSENENFIMTPSGRFAHSKTYLDTLIADNHLIVRHYEMIALRTQNHEPVLGHFYVVEK
jgi:predicted TPR repeat methyltransferase